MPPPRPDRTVDPFVCRLPLPHRMDGDPVVGAVPPTAIPKEDRVVHTVLEDARCASPFRGVERGKSGHRPPHDTDACASDMKLTSRRAAVHEISGHPVGFPASVSTFRTPAGSIRASSRQALVAGPEAVGSVRVQGMEY